MGSGLRRTGFGVILGLGSRCGVSRNGFTVFMVLWNRALSSSEMVMDFLLMGDIVAKLAYNLVSVSIHLGSHHD